MLAPDTGSAAHLLSPALDRLQLVLHVCISCSWLNQLASCNILLESYSERGKEVSFRSKYGGGHEDPPCLPFPLPIFPLTVHTQHFVTMCLGGSPYHTLEPQFQWDELKWKGLAIGNNGKGLKAYWI